METWYSQLFKKDSICFAALQMSFVQSPAFCFFLFKNKQKNPSGKKTPTIKPEQGKPIIFLNKNF